MQGETEKVSWIERYNDEWMVKCPECGSEDIQKLDIFKGMYKIPNPLHKRNQQKCKCKECRFEFYIEI